MAMDTQAKINAEFHNEVCEILARHESKFDKVNVTFQTILAEIEALRVSRSTDNSPTKINSFHSREISHSSCDSHHETPKDLHHHLQGDLDIAQPLPSIPSIFVIMSSVDRDKHRVQSQPTLEKPKPYSTPTSSILGSPSNQRGKPDMSTPTIFQHIINQEARENREKGLCYYCDEKFVPGHRCERTQLFMIEDSPFPVSIGDDIMEQKIVRELPFHSSYTNHPT